MPGLLSRIHPGGPRFASELELSTPERLLGHLGSFRGDASWVMSPDATASLRSIDERKADADTLTGYPARLQPDQEAVLSYIRGYLQNDILVKVDRASMAASLEVRAPFLDPNVVEFSLGLPQKMKMRGLTGKVILRKLMGPRLPSAILNRPKVGFGAPMSAWLRGPLRPLVGDYLSTSRLKSGNCFDPIIVANLVEEHMAGDADHGNQLWLLLQFELWRSRWLETV
jgi:asparagine synthetase B (glutamine-hydrolysing)